MVDALPPQPDFSEDMQDFRQRLIAERVQESTARVRALTLGEDPHPEAPLRLVPPDYVNPDGTITNPEFAWGVAAEALNDLFYTLGGADIQEVRVGADAIRYWAFVAPYPYPPPLDKFHVYEVHTHDPDNPAVVMLRAGITHDVTHDFLETERRRLLARQSEEVIDLTPSSAGTRPPRVTGWLQRLLHH